MDHQYMDYPLLKYLTMLKSFFRYSSKSSKTKQSGVSYTGCSDLPLLNFIKIVTSGDLKWLIKTGEVDGLESIWETIYNEYSEISQGVKIDDALEVSVDISYYSNRIKNTNAIVDYLRKRVLPELITELQSMGYPFIYTDLSTDLDRTITMSKGDVMKLNQAKARYVELSGDEGEKATEIDWRRKVSQIAKYQGVATINTALISVYDFVALDKEFNEYVDFMKRENAKQIS